MCFAAPTDSVRAVTAESNDAPSSTRPLIWIAAGLGALVVLTIVLLAVRSPASFEPGTPEHTVQQYLQAVLDGDERRAATYFSEESRCSAEDFRYGTPVRNVRITLVDSEDFGDEAEVTVRIRFDETAIDRLASYDREEFFRLASEGGEWKLVGEAWPIYFCEEQA